MQGLVGEGAAFVVAQASMPVRKVGRHAAISDHPRPVGLGRADPGRLHQPFQHPAGGRFRPAAPAPTRPAFTARPVTPTTRTTTPAPPQPSPRSPELSAWSTGPRVTAVTDPTTQLAGVHAAEHASFDRVVFKFRGRVPGYDVRYVRAVTQDPTDQPIRLQGGAVLRVVLRHASTSPGPGGGPVPLFVGTIAPDLPSLKQVKVAGDFEHQLSFGLGLDHRVAFRVVTLSGPSRVVVDVAHAPAPSRRSRGSGTSAPGRTRGSSRTRSSMGTSPGGAPPTGW